MDAARREPFADDVITSPRTSLREQIGDKVEIVGPELAEQHP